MKRAILAAFLMAVTPALAQQQPPATPGQKALEIMLNREVAAHQADLGAAIQLNDQVDALKKQVSDLTKERDNLKVAANSEQSLPPKPESVTNPTAAPKADPAK